MNYVMRNAVDLFTTFQSLDKGTKQANPFARLFIDNKPLAVIVKGGITAGVLFGLAQVKKEDKRAAVITLGLLDIIYGIVGTNNIGMYLQLN